jgi:two-component system NtrC family sensor kinase
LSFWKKIKPAFWDDREEELARGHNFRRIWWINFLVASLITLTPLLILVFYCIDQGYLGDRTLYWLLLIVIPVTLAVIWVATLRQVERLYNLDIHRNEVLKEIVYTHKMASVGRLASGLAHEINNPMAVVREKTGLAQDLIAHHKDEVDWERILGLLGDIQDSSKRAGSITHRLLGFGRHFQMEPEDLDLAQLVDDVTGFFRQKSHYRDIKVAVESQPGLPNMQADRNALEQITFNLLDNAFASVPDGGNIKLSMTSHSGDTIRLTIDDDGPGIDPDDMKHIFEPFFSTRGSQHAGLGLSIVYGIVHKLGGEIHAESEVGEGLTVFVILPLSQKLQQAGAVEEEIGLRALHAPGAGD